MSFPNNGKEAFAWELAKQNCAHPTSTQDLYEKYVQYYKEINKLVIDNGDDISRTLN